MQAERRVGVVLMPMRRAVFSPLQGAQDEKGAEAAQPPRSPESDTVFGSWRLKKTPPGFTIH